MLSGEKLVKIADAEMGKGGLFVYDSQMMAETAQNLLDAKMPYGMITRYAVKANPHPKVISLFDQMGLHFDAGSAPEAVDLIKEGIDGSKISLSSQVLDEDEDLSYLLGEGVLPVATTLDQIRMLGRFGMTETAVRINPGVGSGHDPRTSVAGPQSDFGIWHEQLAEVLDEVGHHDMTVNRIHTHIGSGVSDSPESWRKTIFRSLKIVEQFPDVDTLDIGGGYGVARIPDEKSTNMGAVMRVFGEEIEEFSERTGREIKLEIEPGTWLVGNAGTLLGRVKETPSTSMYDFIRLNVGMNAILRISHYGAQHPITVLNDSKEWKKYVVKGPCCESGDILTPAPGNPKEIQPRKLRKVEIGDYLAIGGAGAYCMSMSPIQYNKVPPPTETVV